MPPRGWKTINLPAEMLEEVVEFINRKDVKRNYAFGNPSEFTRRAIAEYVARIKRELQLGEDWRLSPEEHRKLDQEEKSE